MHPGTLHASLHTCGLDDPFIPDYISNHSVLPFLITRHTSTHLLLAPLVNDTLSQRDEVRSDKVKLSKHLDTLVPFVGGCVSDFESGCLCRGTVPGV